MRFVNTQLGDVVQSLAELGDVEIKAEGLDLTRRISVDLKDVPLETALSTAIRGLGLGYRFSPPNTIEIVKASSQSLPPEGAIRVGGNIKPPVKITACGS